MYKIIAYTSLISTLIPFVAGLVNFKDLNKTLRVLILYSAICIGVEILSMIMSRQNTNNYVVQNGFTLFEFSLLSFIYRLEFFSRNSKSMILFIFLGYVFVAYMSLIHFDGFDKENNVLTTIESVIMISFSTAYFYILDSRREQQKLNQHYFFWINLAILIYFSTSFFLFLFDQYLVQFELALYQYIYSIHHITNISYNILLSIGIWKIKLR